MQILLDILYYVEKYCRISFALRNRLCDFSLAVQMHKIRLHGIGDKEKRKRKETLSRSKQQTNEYVEIEMNDSRCDFTHNSIVWL